MKAAQVDPLVRNNVHVTGNVDASDALVFIHGLGADQTVWSDVAAHFRRDYRIVLLDHVGTGQSGHEAFLQDRYLNLKRYASDLVEVCRALGLHKAVLIGHSVGAMIAALATLEEPGRFSKLVMIGASPRYRDDEGYRGGMSQADISAVYDSAMTDYAQWGEAYSRQVMRNAGRPQLAERFAAGLRQIPRRHLLTVLCSILQTDYRQDIAGIAVPTLLLHARFDAAVPPEVAEYMHRQIAGSTLVTIDAEGHLPHVSAPDAVAAEIAAFLGAPV